MRMDMISSLILIKSFGCLKHILMMFLHADVMTGVSDPFQPFDDHTPTNEISHFVMDSSDFDFPEWYEDEQVQEVTLVM